MGIDDEPADIGFLEDAINTRDVTALGQPDADRIDPEALPVIIAPDKDLRPHRFRIALHQREKSMGGCAGDDFEDAVALQLGEGRHDIALNVLQVKALRLEEARMVKPGQFVESPVVGGALDLQPRELNARLI